MVSCIWTQPCGAAFMAVSLDPSNPLGEEAGLCVKHTSLCVNVSSCLCVLVDLAADIKRNFKQINASFGEKQI